MNSNRPIRVMVVDDHAVVRSSLDAFLRAYDDLQLAGMAKSEEEAISLCADIQPDVVLMDLVTPGIDGAITIRSIKKNSPNSQVLVLVTFKEDVMIQKAIQAGAIGYLLKDVQADDIAEAIRLAHRGISNMNPMTDSVILSSRNQASKPGYDLNERELEVLALMVKGLNNTEIAEKLSANLPTIKHYVSNILTKLDTSNRAETVALAVKDHLVS